jgi:hypothetical protein
MVIDEKDLNLINKYVAADFPAYTADELEIVTFVAADNLITRDQNKWHVRTLPKIAGLLAGLPMTLDHDWGSVEKVQGLVFKARVVKAREPPEGLIDCCGCGRWNKDIVAEEGYQYVECSVAFPATAVVVSSLRLGAVGRVSIGGFLVNDYICPLCEISFFDEACPHWAPHDIRDTKDKQFAPYKIRKGITDLTEISLVLAGNLPGARAINRAMKEQLNQGLNPTNESIKN